jgi:SAM-dependent methyltransferase
MARVNTVAFWEDAYARGGDGWELGRPAPPLVDFLDTTPPPLGRVAVPGCGRGHDARLLATRGYEVIGFDFAPAALAAARALAARERVAARFEDRDVFALGRELPNGFDGVWEYT